MKFFVTLALTLLTTSAFAAPKISKAQALTIECGNDDARVTIFASKADPLSTPKVTGLQRDGETAEYNKADVTSSKSGDKYDVVGFGPKRYEYITAVVETCTDDGATVVGSAEYSRYDETKPANGIASPMEKLDVNCTCSVAYAKGKPKKSE